MYHKFGGVVLGVVVLLLAGCGPPIADEELGRIIFHVPEIPPGHEPYTLPSGLAPRVESGELAPAEPDAGELDASDADSFDTIPPTDPTAPTP